MGFLLFFFPSGPPKASCGPDQFQSFEREILFYRSANWKTQRERPEGSSGLSQAACVVTSSFSLAAFRCRSTLRSHPCRSRGRPEPQWRSAG